MIQPQKPKNYRVKYESFLAVNVQISLQWTELNQTQFTPLGPWTGYCLLRVIKYIPTLRINLIFF